MLLERLTLTERRRRLRWLVVASGCDHVEATLPSEYIANTVTSPRSSPVRYSTQGPLRGRCGHKHKNLDGALECLDADDALCIERGGRTDRRVYAVTSQGWRELNDDELAAVDLYRKAFAPKTGNGQ